MAILRATRIGVSHASAPRQHAARAGARVAHKVGGDRAEQRLVGARVERCDWLEDAVGLVEQHLAGERRRAEVREEYVPGLDVVRVGGEGGEQQRCKALKLHATLVGVDVAVEQQREARVKVRVEPNVHRVRERLGGVSKQVGYRVKVEW
eukprot:scaffold17605_cov54-Phaeocystis_antarctica.AAC.2